MLAVSAGNNQTSWVAMENAKITSERVTRSVDMKLPLNQAKLTVGYIFKIIFWYILVIS